MGRNLAVVMRSDAVRSAGGFTCEGSVDRLCWRRGIWTTAAVIQLFSRITSRDGLKAQSLSGWPSLGAQQAGPLLGFPSVVRTDERPKFNGRVLMAWTRGRNVQHLLNEAGSPAQNAYIESFNGKFRSSSRPMPSNVVKEHQHRAPIVEHCRTLSRRPRPDPLCGEHLRGCTKPVQIDYSPSALR